jgi:hypothetical protein
MVYVFTVQSFPLNPDKSSTPLTFVDSIRVLYQDGPLLLKSPKLYLRPTNMDVVSYGQIHQVDNLVVRIYMSLPCSACFGFTILASGVTPWLRKPPHDIPWNDIFHGVFGLTFLCPPDLSLWWWGRHGFWHLPLQGEATCNDVPSKSRENTPKKILFTRKHDETAWDCEDPILY